MDMTERLKQVVLGNTSLQIIGNASYKSHEIMAKEMKTSLAMMENLGIGEFIIKAGNKPTVKIQVRSDYVGSKKTVNSKDWNELKKAMLEKYYRRKSEVEKLETKPEKTEIKVKKPKYIDNNFNGFNDIDFDKK
jgi:hypothetical protein